MHVAKIETLAEAYRSQENGGAPGIDGQTFEAIEAAGWTHPEELREELSRERINHGRIAGRDPEGDGKVRVLQIPCIRDRVVQGALKLILEAIFEADFCKLVWLPPWVVAPTGPR